jgi:hypothetical protein
MAPCQDSFFTAAFNSAFSAAVIGVEVTTIGSICSGGCPVPPPPPPPPGRPTPPIPPGPPPPSSSGEGVTTIGGRTVTSSSSACATAAVVNRPQDPIASAPTALLTKLLVIKLSFRLPDSHPARCRTGRTLDIRRRSPNGSDNAQHSLNHPTTSTSSTSLAAVCPVDRLLAVTCDQASSDRPRR